MTLGYGIIIYSLLKKPKRGGGAPLTLADVFLGLGSGFGGAGFCKDKLSYTNTEKTQPSAPKGTGLPKTVHFDYDVHFKKKKNTSSYFQHQVAAKRPPHFITIFILGSQVNGR